MSEGIVITPHWPGVIRWVRCLAKDGLAYMDEPDAVAITGGKDTTFYARIPGGAVYRWEEGTTWHFTGLTWAEVEEVAYIYERENHDGTVTQGGPGSEG